jgi:hypothetical protein
MTSWIQRIRSKFLWNSQVKLLQAQVSLARTALGREVPFILFILGMALIDNGIRMLSLAGAWIFAGGVLVFLAVGKERSDTQPIPLAEEEVEKLKKMYSRRTPGPG